MITDALLRSCCEAAANAAGKTGPEDWRQYGPHVRGVLAIMEVAFLGMSEDKKEEPDYSEVPTSRPTFEQALKGLINSYSMENGSDTPDFMLAEYLGECLSTFNIFINKREKWYGRENLGQKQPATGDMVPRAGTPMDPRGDRSYRGPDDRR